jgi:hypothetical protein
MMSESTKYNYDTFSQDATGQVGNIEKYKIITFPFGKYEIKVKLTLSNEFLGIIEVGVSKDFISVEQKMNLKGYHDVEKLYEE